MKPNSVGIVIPTFGDPQQWYDIAEQARDSVYYYQTHEPDQVICIHGDNITDTRNAGWKALSTEWVIFLDADDYLDDHYIEDMLKYPGDVRYPLVSWDNKPPVVIQHSTENLVGGNYIVIGAMVWRKALEDIGGFRSLPYWDDWDLWLRLQRMGYKIHGSGAIYHVNKRSGSMNDRPIADPDPERIFERFLK